MAFALIGWTADLAAGGFTAGTLPAGAFLAGDFAGSAFGAGAFAIAFAFVFACGVDFFFGAGRAAGFFGEAFFGVARFAADFFGEAAFPDLLPDLAFAALFARTGLRAALFFDLLALFARAVLDFLAATRRLLDRTGFPPGRLPATTSRDDKGFRR